VASSIAALADAISDEAAETAESRTSFQSSLSRSTAADMVASSAEIEPGGPFKGGVPSDPMPLPCCAARGGCGWVSAAGVDGGAGTSWPAALRADEGDRPASLLLGL